jgi:hypothetical protein
MKNLNTKKLNRQISTVCDFSRKIRNSPYSDTTNTGTDPTNTAGTVITTTVNTYLAVKS